MERPLLDLWPLTWFIPGNPGTHILSVGALAFLASWSWYRYRWRGLLIPALVLCYSEAQFQIIVLGVYHGPFIDIIFLPAAPAVTILYGVFMRRVPWRMLLAGYAVLLLDVFDGFRVTYGFPPGSPLLYDPYTNAKEIASWCVVCFAAWIDNRHG